jgi:hypothetical protein
LQQTTVVILFKESFTMKKTVVVLSLLATSAASAGQSTDVPPDFCRGAGDDISQHVIFSSDDHGLNRGRVECHDGVGGVVGTIDYAFTRSGRMEAEATFPSPAAARGELAGLRACENTPNPQQHRQRIRYNAVIII